jgi:hypothetical protein
MGGMICMSNGPHPRAQRAYYEIVERDIHQLRGKNLACWCALVENGKPVPCHADVLMRIAARAKASHDR